MSLLVEVKQSPIHGKGVFATCDIKAGECVIDWHTCSDILTQEDAEALSPDEQRYVSFVGGKYIHFTSAPGKYVNHSCNPNTRAESWCDVATKDIMKGEEVTADYKAELVLDMNFECACDLCTHKLLNP